MDKEQNQSGVPEQNDWLDDFLGTSDSARELGADELAVHAAGLKHPNDMELEQILAEDWDSVPEAQEPVTETDESTVSAEESPATPMNQDTQVFPVQPDPVPVQEPTQFFTPVSDTQAVQVPEEPAEQKAEENKAKPERKAKSKKAADKEDPNVQKTRPEPQKGYGLLGVPHILSTLIWLLIILAIGVTLGRTLWVSCADLMAFGKPDQQVTVTITQQDDIDSISQKLADADLIEYPTLFKMFATLTGKDQEIQAGTFTLNSKFDYNALINNMYNYGEAREEIDIMIPEGYTCAQIFSLMEEKGVCSVSELEHYAAYGDLPDYWFLQNIDRGDKYCLEGYLFPDTYRFYTNDDPANVIKKFLDGFDYRFTDVMKEKLETIAERTGLSLDIRDVVILASMIEKETASTSESYAISSVIYNRLNNAADFPYLNIDATLIYALGGNIDPETGMSMPLTEEDMYTDHPYNTYTRRGLPPGPIANPGRNSLDAALDPQSTDFYYYVYNPQDGEHIFASTLWEHEQNIAYVNSLD